MVLTKNQKTMARKVYPLLIALFCISCTSETPDPTPTPTENIYFPPITGTVWETKTISSLGWNQAAVQPLLDYLELKNSKGFILKIDFMKI